MFDCWRRVAAASWMSLCLSAQAAPNEPMVPVPVPIAVSRDVQATARWVLQRADHRGRPFAIVDKNSAQIVVFDAIGVPIGSSPVLLGLASGDRDAVPQMGLRTPASLAPSERTTPAGRFDSEPGRNDKGEAIVWFDYDAALAIHRLRPAPEYQQRPQRMASINPLDRRITFGCVVVPEAFYDDVIAPTLGRRRGVVYVLPEERPARAMMQAADLVPAAMD